MQTFEQVVALINAYTALFPDDEYGPAHCVLSDYNMDDDSLREARMALSDPWESRLALFLMVLSDVPEDIRDQPQVGWDCPHCGAAIWSYERPAICSKCGKES